MSWTLTVGYLPHHYSDFSKSTYWILGIVLAFVTFASILIHELFHSYTAKKYGIKTSRIVLFIFGGVSQITEEAKDPAIEFKVSVAGPLSSYLLTILFGTIWYILRQMDSSQTIQALFQYGMFINIMLGTFNLIPAFPLDGGRILRAFLWQRTEDLVKATSIASKIGVAFSYVLMFSGFTIIILWGLINGMLLFFIGWFLKNGSESSMKQTVIGEALVGFNVGKIMTKKVHTISENVTASEIIDNFLKHKHGGFPVVKDGELTGCVTIHDVKKVPKEKWNETKANQIMTKKNKLILTSPKEPVIDAMTKMSKHKIGRLPVVQNGKLTGIISRSDILHIIKAKTELK